MKGHSKAFNLIYWTRMTSKYFPVRPLLKKKKGKKAVFFRAATTRFGIYHTGDDGQIGVYRVND